MRTRCVIILAAFFSVNVHAGAIRGDCGANEAPTWRYKETQTTGWDYDHDVSELFTTSGHTQPVIEVAYTNPVFQQDGDDAYKFTGVRRNDNSLVLTSQWARTRPRGTTVTYSCLNGVGVFGVTMHSDDVATTDIEYGNPHVAYLYRFDNDSRPQPWTPEDYDDVSFGPRPPGHGALTLSLNLHNPLFVQYGGQRGGNVVLSVILNPVDGGDGIAYTISLYRLSERQRLHYERVVQHDPNNGYVHVTGSVYDGANYLTKGANSADTQYGRRGTFPGRGDVFTDYFNVSLTYGNVKRMIGDVCRNIGAFCGRAPEDFAVRVVKVMTEMHKDPRAMAATAFSNFTATWP